MLVTLLSGLPGRGGDGESISAKKAQRDELDNESSFGADQIAPREIRTGTLSRIKDEEPELRNDLAISDIQGALDAQSFLAQVDLIEACRNRNAPTRKEELAAL